eukprot:TRINITY_DN22062_c0_g1_i1.p1 TRINITY_DN22062_c0_g1~~TRINITY_DN22062_c0_g1_i1.p1  ORF type:complete len:276 (-),score=60.99 TRINITY_DN22062_c0_g1_i1:66-893(-)
MMPMTYDEALQFATNEKKPLLVYLAGFGSCDPDSDLMELLGAVGREQQGVWDYINENFLGYAESRMDINAGQLFSEVPGLPSDPQKSCVCVLVWDAELDETIDLLRDADAPDFLGQMRQCVEKYKVWRARKEELTAGRREYNKKTSELQQEQRQEQEDCVRRDQQANATPSAPPLDPKYCLSYPEQPPDDSLAVRVLIKTPEGQRSRRFLASGPAQYLFDYVRKKFIPEGEFEVICASAPAVPKPRLDPLLSFDEQELGMEGTKQKALTVVVELL